MPLDLHAWQDPCIATPAVGAYAYRLWLLTDMWLGSRVVSVRRRVEVQIVAATLSGNSIRQTVHTHCASVHQAAKLVAALLKVAGVTASLAESDGSLPRGSWLISPAGWLPRNGISSGTLRSVIEYWLPLPFTPICRRCAVSRHSLGMPIFPDFYITPNSIIKLSQLTSFTSLCVHNFPFL